MRIIISLILLTFIFACNSNSGKRHDPSIYNDPVNDDNNNQNTFNGDVSELEIKKYVTAEYQNQRGLSSINAAEAYAILEKNNKPIAGSGVVVAVTDSGLNISHREISSNYIAENSYDYVGKSSNMKDYDNHGTHVSSTIAGVKDSQGMHGVAYNSKLVSFAIIDPSHLVSTSEINDVGNRVGNASAKIVNASWGYDLYSQYNGDKNYGAGASLFDQIFVDILSNKLKTSDALFIAAAGNDASPLYTSAKRYESYSNFPKPGKPALFANHPDLEGYVLAVVAVDSEKKISDFSNRCTVTKNYCLAAPGTDIYAAISNPLNGYDFYSGTSMAAPHVSGAAAVLRAAWPQLTAKQTSQILLESADDLGDPGVDDVYGHGMLNLAEAVKAKGENIIPLAKDSTKGLDVRNSNLVSSTIFGSSFTENLSREISDVIFLDKYGRDYKAFLGSKININNDNKLSNVTSSLISNYESKSIPLNLGFLGSQYQSTKLNLFVNTYNKTRIKNFTYDNSSTDRESSFGSGFSLVQKFGRDFMMGFSANNDSISQINKDDSLSSLSFTSLSDSPYKNFITNNNRGQNGISFNQFFLKNNLLDTKLAINFSYQSSSNKNQLLKNTSRQNEISDIGLKYSFNKDDNIYLSFGKLNEYNNLFLNSRSSGALSFGPKAESNYYKISVKKNLFKNIAIFATSSESSTNLAGSEMSIFKSFTNIVSRSRSLGLVGKSESDDYNFGFVYNEPLRIYKGSVNIEVPIGLDSNFDIVRRNSDISLVTNGKERDYEIFYKQNFKDSFFGMNMIFVKDYGNVKSRKNNYIYILNYSIIY